MERLISKRYTVDGYSIVDYNDVPNAENKLSYIRDTLNIRIDENMLSEFYSFSEVNSELDIIRHKGCPVRRAYCLFGMKEDEIIVSTVFAEVLNHPDGFGEKDFDYHRRINHDFIDEHNDVYGLRLLIVCMVHMLLKSLADRLYTYALSDSLYDGDNVFLKLDTKFECTKFSDWSDKVDKLNYISVLKERQINNRKYVLVVFNSEDYKKMNHVESFRSLTGDRDKALSILSSLEEACEDIVINRQI